MISVEHNLFVSTTFAADGSSIFQVVDLLCEHGITNIELGSNHQYEPDFLLQLKKKSCRFLVHNYFPIPKRSFVLNVASENPEIVRRSISQIYSAIEFCHDLGAELYTFHPGFLTDPDGASRSSDNYDFQFKNDVPETTGYDAAYSRMLSGIEKAVVRAHELGVRIAIETEGSVGKKNHLLMQRPEEFDEFYTHFSPEDVGVNLNLGHLRLAAVAFGFSIEEFVKKIADATVAIEMSHNKGVNDDHLPLQEYGWYWPLLEHSRLRHLPKILEVRNIPVEQVAENIRMCASKLNKGLC